MQSFQTSEFFVHKSRDFLSLGLEIQAKSCPAQRQKLIVSNEKCRVVVKQELEYSKRFSRFDIATFSNFEAIREVRISNHTGAF